MASFNTHPGLSQVSRKESSGSNWGDRVFPKLSIILIHRYIRLGIESNRCPTSRARRDLDQPRVNAPTVKEVAATGELPAPLAVAEAVEADNATGFGRGFESPGDAEAGKIVEIGRRIRVGAEAEAVEGTAKEEEVKEEEGGEAEEEEEEGGEEKHDDWFEEKGEKVGG
ncbi:hypothetical protein TanjilG_26162 [Lupinus angustifolius]|uniref:Uncharacterized protein n=1 Tax=Lupinus angustifolius TaxID=3871 RepID=A0A4P1R2D2_LUPAN|nr:hypothetical protein TanjilG_26162 [Lupinus angustifolius]